MLIKAMKKVLRRPSQALFFAGASQKEERASRYLGTFFALRKNEYSFALEEKSPSLGKERSLHGIRSTGKRGSRY
jgi:hypothetical protein